MFNGHGLAKSCSVLAVLCGNFADRKEEDVKDSASYPFKDLVSSGRLEVHTLVNPSISKFREVQNSTTPNILYLQGEKFVDEDEIGSLVWAGVDVSEPEELCSHIGPSLPTAAYLEFQDSEKASEALYAKGIPYVIYWKSGFPSYSASHFRHAFFSVVQSSSSHIWDAFQLAHASFRFYCVNNSNNYPVNTCKVSGKAVPCMLGEAPKCSIPPEEKVSNDEEESLSDIVPAISIYDGGVDTAFLVCGMPSKLDTTLDPLEDGINALLRIEIRGSKLHNRVSATPPPSLQTGGFSSGVVTMRCDLTTCSSAHISLLVSGSPQILFDDQLLEIYIKNELTEKSQLVHAMPSSEENKTCFVEPRRSSSIACGASVFEVCMKIPIWATQILKQLAPDVSYRSLVALGIASIQGSSVSSFEKEDAERLLFFCNEQASLDTQDCTSLSPCWFKIPAPSSSPVVDQEMNLWSPGMTDINVRNDKRGRDFHPVPVRHRLKISAMRPVPHKRQHKMMPFAGTPEHEINNNGFLKPNLPPLSYKKHTTSAPVSRRKSQSSSGSQQITTLNPLPLRKHGCDRSSIRDCTEEEFLTDVMEFLILRGHNRLIPEGGVSEFPDVILNAKRLDLYNLYREVVSRGGFHVGNGINWKGQVFSKMRNHTLSNRMTGVGNSLKRHYETYLLEYELAHDDVDGEFCLLCHSAPGDWVNCGLCGEWAHFGCDRRQGLGAFKDYAKTDGLEYICPQCSIATAKRKSLKVGE